jgi:hypothetical protein
VCDLAEARRFIAALTGTAVTPVTFQTFRDDIKNRGGPHFFGTIDEHFAELSRLNARCFGVFVVVNEGRPGGLAKEDITAPRALFLDDDGDAGAPVAFAGNGQSPFAAASPSITVQVKRGQHHYFVLKPGESLERFSAAQEQLADHFKTDLSVNSRNKVMRLPGFLHQKNPAEPFLVRVVQTQPISYSIDEVLAAYQAPPSAPRKPGKKPSKGGKQKGTASPAPEGTPATADVLERARAYMAQVPPAIEGQHGDNATFSVCAHLVIGFMLSDQEALPILLEWNRS